MEKPEKPFNVAVVVKQKHGDLYQAMRQRGWNQRQLAEFLGISQNEVGRIMNFRGKPPGFRGNSKKLASFKEKLMELTGKSFDDLFPDEVFNDEVFARAKTFDFTVERDVAQLKLDSSGTELVVYEELGEHLSHVDIPSIIREELSDRQLKVVMMRYFKNMTYARIADDMGMSIERVRQIEARALRKLRLPSTLRMLRGDDSSIEDRALKGAFVGLMKKEDERRAASVRQPWNSALLESVS